ncbi:hypothetical protein [Shewanella chilikensis]|uniref:hypothetical protein n=1 Tax=Shewanella chilikensis TaxID=558541 RepID=UPI001F2420DC|nr:hypothetical protein [Shewanella chilikensis]MCE9788069.1 hypothetical protein [Shewanella chilikensis]
MGGYDVKKPAWGSRLEIEGVKVKLENRLLLVFRWAESERWFLTTLILNRFGL